MSAKTTRDTRLDALRGLMLVVITIDHLPSFLSQITYQCLGYTTAAEGFVFLSGLVAGRVYSRTDFTEGMKLLWHRVLKRAAKIYSYNALAFLLLFTLVVLFGFKTYSLEAWIPLFYERPLLALSMGLTLTNQPRLFDILPMYCLFILTVPLIVRHSTTRNHVMILLISGLIWLTAQFGVQERLELVLSNYAPANFGSFNILAWQFLFTMGLIVGVRKKNPDQSPIVLRNPKFIGCVIVAFMLFLCSHHFLPIGTYFFRMAYWSDVGTLGPIRLLNFLLIAYIFSKICKWPTNNIWNNALAYLGRHSLQVFTFHIILIYLFYGVVFRSIVSAWWVVLCVALLFLPAWLCENQKSLLWGDALLKKIPKA